jgi:hypothetical protein
MSQQEKPAESRQRQDPENITISTSSGQMHDWIDYKKVTLARCFNSVIPETLARSKDTLTDLTFSEYTLFKNIKRCLKNLHSLKSLHFCDVIIDAYHRFLYTKIIDVPTVTTVSISRSTRLTNSEYFLIDFLTRGVNFKSLKTFKLREESRLEESHDDVSEAPNENHELLEEFYDHDVVIVARFLMKHHISLRNVSIEGTQVKVWDSEKTKEHFVQNLKLLKLDSFNYSMNDAGLNLILSHQQQLKHLQCTTDATDSEKIQNIYDCIKESQKTISSFQIKIRTIERNANGEENCFECKHLERCENLLSFELITKMPTTEGATDTEIPTNNNAFSFEVLNMHLLPPSLQRLSLKSESFADDNLEKLFEKLPKFADLEAFKLEASNKSTFNFKLSWLQTLCKLPRIRSVTINGAFVDVKQEIEELIEGSRQHISISFNYNDISCFPCKRQ